MSAWNDPEDEDPFEDEGYFAEVDEGDLTGKDPRFFKIDSLDLAPDVMATMKVDDLIGLYIDARNQLATDRKGYKAREAKVKTHLSVISMLLRDKGDTLGVDNFKTERGTAFRNKKEKFSIPMWEDLVNYIKATGNFQVLQKRVSPNAVKDIRDEEGALPPGIDSFTEVEFAVRSPTVRKPR